MFSIVYSMSKIQVTSVMFLACLRTLIFSWTSHPLVLSGKLMAVAEWYFQMAEGLNKNAQKKNEGEKENLLAFI